MIPVAEEWSRLARPGIDHDADYLADALKYAFNTAFMQMPKQKSYACECKKCNLTLYTSTKRVNCEYCGSSDPGVFECRELK